MKTILIRPIISEKTLRLAETENQYTFRVDKGANKTEVIQAIKDKFNVSALRVRILNNVGKSVRFGRKRLTGRKSNFKKALILLKQGDSIPQFNIK